MKTHHTRTRSAAHHSRRAALRGGAASTLGLLFRGLATGLPPAWLINPSAARAQSMMETPIQTLILSTSSAGDPLNANCPGSYTASAENNPDLPSGPVELGGVTAQGAQAWGMLPSALRERLAFFHYGSRAVAHPEYAATMGFRGSVKNEVGNGTEMFASMVAQLTHESLGTLQQEPLPLCNEVLTFRGQPLQRVNPSDLQALFQGQEEQVGDLRSLRDDTLNRLYSGLRAEGSQIQKEFVDRYILSRDQARAIGEQLGGLLSRLPTNPDEPNSVQDQVIAAVAVAKLKIAPVITIRIPFGGDNHQDETLTEEATQTLAGVAAISSLWDELGAEGLRDSVSFATLNVFGRQLVRNNNGGRDHNPDHAVMVAFGPRVNGGVYGGLNEYNVARNIDPVSGAGVDSGGIGLEETQESAGRSLASSLGISSEALEPRIQGGQAVSAFTRS